MDRPKSRWRRAAPNGRHFVVMATAPGRRRSSSTPLRLAIIIASAQSTTTPTDKRETHARPPEVPEFFGHLRSIFTRLSDEFQTPGPNAT